MKHLLLCLTLAFSFSASAQSGSQTSTTTDTDSAVIRRIFDEALTNEQGYKWLDHLCNQIGQRLSASANAEKAVQYVKAEMEKLPNATVRLQPCMVPNWKRGEKEAAWFESKGKKTTVNICALGGSVATPVTGVKAQVVMVHDFDELKALGKEKVQGKIVFMDHPMKQTYVHTFEAYGAAARYRWMTASEGAALGAVAVVVRSMNISLDDYPHTGSMGYKDSTQKIPACAISTNDAEKLKAAIAADPGLTFWYKQNCSTGPDAPSANVIAEIKGTEFPDEYIVVGGHLDSWDLAQGAHDDGTGIVQSMEVIRLFNAIGFKPKRSIRFVAFMNEENGNRGGEKYAEESKNKGEKNIAALESDEGGFTPRGFTFRGDSLMMKKLMAWQSIFEAYDLRDWRPGYGGTDINPMEDQGTMLIGYMPDSQRYFDIHHSALDTFDRVNHRELQLGAASIAGLIYLISEYGVR